MIKIVFGKSSSQNYNLALRRAKRDSMKFYEQNKDNIFMNIAEYDFDKLSKAEKLWELVSGWKSAELFIKDISAGKNDLICLKGILSCMNRHDESIIPQEYCSMSSGSYDLGSYFGCKKLTAVLKTYMWKDASYYFLEAPNLWYKLSKIDKVNNRILINKDRIKQMLLEQVDQNLVKFCPYFYQEETIKMIEDLPSEINLNDSDDYIVDFSDEYYPTIRSKEEVLRREDLEKQNTIKINIGDQDNNERLTPKVTNVFYKDIGGLDREIRLIRESVEIPFKHPEIFVHLGITAYKGILFYGPPGTGKTQLAKAVANESDMNFYTINGPEIFNKYFGESEKKLRDIFETAKNNAPAVIFIDEIDSIASKRGDSSNEVFYNKIVTQLLTLMDGMEEREQVIVMAATNRPDSLDPALRRPGRLDFEIYIPPPDEKGRAEILNIHSSNMPLDKDVNLLQLAESIHGYVGADIAALCKEAALFALRRKVIDFDSEVKDIEKIKVTMDDFKQAKNKIIPTAGREVLSFKPNIRWDDVIGLDTAKKELEKKIIKPWLMRNKYTGFRKIKGLLLYGKSGVGKTYLSKALASELNMNVISLKGSDILSKFQGGSALNIKHYFDKARELAPCMIIIDEIDAVASSREQNKMSADMVNELLSQMDGYDELTDVVIVGTTNLISFIDSAVLRAGRFDLLIELEPPNKEVTKKLFKYYLEKAPIPYDKTLDKYDYPNLTGAEVENKVNQALYEAIWNGDSVLLSKHFIF